MTGQLRFHGEELIGDIWMSIGVEPQSYNITFNHVPVMAAGTITYGDGIVGGGIFSYVPADFQITPATGYAVSSVTFSVGGGVAHTINAPNAGGFWIIPAMYVIDNIEVTINYIPATTVLNVKNTNDEAVQYTNASSRIYSRN